MARDLAGRAAAGDGLRAASRSPRCSRSACATSRTAASRAASTSRCSSASTRSWAKLPRGARGCASARAEALRARRGRGRGRESSRSAASRAPTSRTSSSPRSTPCASSRSAGRLRRDHREDAGRGRRFDAAKVKAEQLARSGGARRGVGCVDSRRSPAVLLAASVAACRRSASGPDLANGELVDLTHAFDERTLYWPTSPSTFQLNTLATGTTTGRLVLRRQRASARPSTAARTSTRPSTSPRAAHGRPRSRCGS